MLLDSVWQRMASSQKYDMYAEKVQLPPEGSPEALQRPHSIIAAGRGIGIRDGRMPL